MKSPPPRALVVEDSREQWPIYRPVLRKLGLEIDEAQNLTDATEFLAREVYKIVIQDLGLVPTPTEAPFGKYSNLEWGEEVYNRIRALTGAPIVIVSQHCGTRSGRAILKRIMPPACVDKPLVPSDFEAILRGLLD